MERYRMEHGQCGLSDNHGSLRFAPLRELRIRWPLAMERYRMEPGQCSCSDNMVASRFAPLRKLRIGGLWQWNGTAWSLVNAVAPTTMVASSSILYGELRSRWPLAMERYRMEPGQCSCSDNHGSLRFAPLRELRIRWPLAMERYRMEPGQCSCSEQYGGLQFDIVWRLRIRWPLAMEWYRMEPGQCGFSGKYGDWSLRTEVRSPNAPLIRCIGDLFIGAPGRARPLGGESPLWTLMAGTVSRTTRASTVRWGLKEVVSKLPARGTRSA